LASAARSIVRGQLGGPVSIGSGGLTLYRGVLLITVVAVLALAVVTVRSGVRLWRGGSQRSRRGVVVRAALVTAVATVTLVMLLGGVPATAGALLSVIPRWAPDVALLLWVLVGEVVVVTLVTLATVARNGRSVGPSSTYVGTVP
jgi:hypothetical protein